MTRSLLKRYDGGDRASVWIELHSIVALSKEPRAVQDAAYQVCLRAMKRAVSNVIAIREHLLATGFPFESENESHILPSNENAELVRALTSLVGPVPLTLQAWLRRVGYVCFRRHPNSSKLVPASDHLLDPLEFQFSPEMLDEERDLRRERINSGEIDACFRLEFAGDLYHKNEISGGAPSYIILPSDSVDALVVEDDCATVVERSRCEGKPLGWQEAVALQGERDRRLWFIDYLREYFNGGGFRRIATEQDSSSLQLSELSDRLVEI
jgi:hypothetical protein